MTKSYPKFQKHTTSPAVEVITHNSFSSSVEEKTPDRHAIGVFSYGDLINAQVLKQQVIISYFACLICSNLMKTYRELFVCSHRITGMHAYLLKCC